MGLILLPVAIALQAAPPLEEPRDTAPAPAQEAETQPEPKPETPPMREGLNTTQKTEAEPLDNEIIEGRERPGFNSDLPDAIDQTNEGALRAPPPQAFPVDQVPIPDRWRLIQGLGLVEEDLLDP